MHAFRRSTTAVAAFILTVVCRAAPIARAADDLPLRQRFSNWATANLDTRIDFRNGIIADADACLNKGDDFVFNCDGDNLRLRKSTTVFTYAGELFIFQLTPAQSKAIGLYAGYATLNGLRTSATAKRLVQPLFQLADIKVDKPDAVPGNQKVTGTFSAKSVGSARPGKVTVRVGYRTDSYTTRAFKSYDAFPANGLFSFSIDSINGKDRDPYFGPMPIFIDLLVTEGDQPSAIAGNTLATLVDVQADHEAFAKSAAVMLGQITDILASVKDSASAAKAVEDYTRVAIRNQAFGEAFSRLPPLPADQDAALTAKYNALAEELGRKMQEQVTRLEKADYAGEAFFDKIQKSVQAASKK